MSAVDIVAKLPEMADDALGVLHANAERLQRVGTQAQQKAAAAAMPAIEAELATRRTAKLERMRAAAAASPKRTKKKKA